MTAASNSDRRNFLGLALAISSLGVAGATAAHASSDNVSSENERLIRRLYEAVNNKNLEVIESYGSPDSEWLDVPFDYTATGQRAIIDPWKAWFDIFPDATCEVRSIAVMGEYVVAQGTGRGTHRGQFNSPAGILPPTGRTMAVSFCDVYRLRDGKILRADSYFDFYGLWKQLTA